MWRNRWTSTASACRTSPHALKVQQLLTNGKCVILLAVASMHRLCGNAPGNHKSVRQRNCSSCCVRPGPCFTVTPKGFVTASHWLALKHAEYLRGDGVKGAKADQTAELICQSLRAGFGKAPHRVELFFVPVHAKSGAAIFPYLPSIKPSAFGA